MSQMPQPGPAYTPRHTHGRAGDIWVSTGKPLTGYGPGKYRLTHEYLFFERGGLSTNAQQIPTALIVDVDMRQSIAQKARGLGSVTVHVNRGGRLEVALIEDIPDYREAVEIINQVAAAARTRMMQAQRTQQINYGGTHQPPTAPVERPSTRPQRDEIAAQLRGAGDMHLRGIITDEQFIAEMHRLLPRL